jgi:hypothetical protein
MRKKKEKGVLDYMDGAQFLGVSQVTLWKYRQAGLRARRVGGEVYFCRKRSPKAASAISGNVTPRREVNNDDKRRIGTGERRVQRNPERDA